MDSTYKVKFFFILSMVIMVVLLIFAFIYPLTDVSEYITVQREQLLNTPEEWILQFDLINHERDTAYYRISIKVNNGKTYQETVRVPEKGVFTYTHHIEKIGIKEGEVKAAIFEEKRSILLEEATYYLK